MSSVTQSPPAAPGKAPKKRRSSKPKKTGPTVSDLILKAVSASKERGGVSLVALKKALAADGYDVVKNNFRVKLSVRRLVANKSLIQTKGNGASGSFKISKKPQAAKKKPAKKAAKKPKAKKTKRAKKSAGAKKSPRKTKRKKKCPMKALTSAAKNAKCPMIAKRSVTKATRAKAAPKKK